MFSQFVSSIFNNTTNSYKFYWWLAILELIKEGEKENLTFEAIVFQIIAKIWYPVNYFKLSFGKQDQFSKYVLSIRDEYGLIDDIKESDLIAFLEQRKSDKFIVDIVRKITNYVPYRFLRTWFSTETRGMKDVDVNPAILDLQDSKGVETPYIIDKDNRLIVLNASYRDWIINNFKIIESYTYFELLKYLEKNNLNVTNISVKLFKPQTRKLSTATKLWKGFIKVNTGLTDIVEGSPLEIIKPMSIDHFLPWSFVTHDLLWNLHPMSRSANSSKSNKLPSEKYISDFSELQYEFSRYLVLSKQDKSLEDYYTTFNIGDTQFKQMTSTIFRDKLNDVILPKLEIASNMGFEKGWKVSHDI